LDLHHCFSFCFSLLTRYILYWLLLVCLILCDRLIGDKLQGFLCLRQFKSHVDWQINHFPVEVLCSHKPVYSILLQISILHRSLMSFLLKNCGFHNNKCNSLSFYRILLQFYDLIALCGWSFILLTVSTHTLIRSLKNPIIYFFLLYILFKILRAVVVYSCQLCRICCLLCFT
jgi:hypothetical protein